MLLNDREGAQHTIDAVMRLEIPVRKKQRVQRSALAKAKRFSLDCVKDRSRLRSKPRKQTCEIVGRHSYFVSEPKHWNCGSAPARKMVFGFAAVIVEHDLFAIEL